MKQLPRFKSVRSHLLDRHVDIDVHRPIIDEAERVATFYLWNLSGELIGYQQYRPDETKEKRNNPRDGRYFTYHQKKTVAVWGLETLHYNTKILFVTEGIFDAARLTKHKVPAIAVLSNDPTDYVRTWIRSLGRLIVVVCDPGPAGRKLARLGDDVVMMKDYDLGDAPEEEVLHIIEMFN